MQRRNFLGKLASLGLIPAMLRQGPALAAAPSAADFPPLAKGSIQWDKILDADRYDVLFREDTEFAGSSPLNKEKRPGTYVCAACLLPLFKSEHKFDSGTGWPSFTQPIEGRIAKRTDYRLIIPRTEYHCARCGGHQGHVFNDGPRPRGERWCNNGLALQFIPEGEPLPPLRT